MPRYLNPPTVPKPASRYSQAVAVGAEYKRLIISGQIGVTASGALAQGVEAQMEQAFDNLLALLAAAGLASTDLVRITCYVTRPGSVAAFRAVREAKLGNHAPACTYLEVAGLADPGYLVEIDGEAVQEASALR